LLAYGGTRFAALLIMGLIAQFLGLAGVAMVVCAGAGGCASEAEGGAEVAASDVTRQGGAEDVSFVGVVTTVGPTGKVKTCVATLVRKDKVITADGCAGAESYVDFGVRRARGNRTETVRHRVIASHRASVDLEVLTLASPVTSKVANVNRWKDELNVGDIVQSVPIGQPDANAGAGTELKRSPGVHNVRELNSRYVLVNNLSPSPDWVQFGMPLFTPQNVIGRYQLVGVFVGPSSFARILDSAIDAN
jgi:hypothetical protein